MDPRGRLAAMRDAMVHRGPDDEGLYLSADARVGLVNRRLAIVDLSAAGRMPMTSGHGVWITHNGEVYNAAELRAELERLGHRFRSATDTEVILQGYDAWGQAVIDRLRGMFAFAILDERQPGWRRLLLARDRLGIKPLYYAATPEAFVFASELRALRASGLVGSEPSPAAVVAYLMLGSVPAPLTVYDEARALEPGCAAILEVDAQPIQLAVRRYWALPTDAAEQRDPEVAANEVRSLLEDAVGSHLLSDVPLGAFLSGGLDSSAVVALMRAVTDGPIRTCTMAFAETGYSEARYARDVAERVGAEHTERVITAADVMKELDGILSAMDQPTVDGVNTYFVAKTAREAGLTVALSGLGGDELFGGYPNTFQGIPRVLWALRVASAVPAAATLGRAALRLGGTGGRWRKLSEALGGPASPASAYLACRGLFAPGEVRRLIEPELWEAGSAAFDFLPWIAERSTPPGRPGDGADRRCDPELFSWVSRAELATYTANQLLRDTDAMSMAHSLEVRVPFLDHRLVEAVLRLPAVVKTAGGRAKGLLVRAVEELLPPSVLARRDKQGFVFPFDIWLRGPLRLRWSMGSAEGLSGILRPDVVAGIWREYDAGHLHWSRPWALAVLQGWRLASQGQAA